MRILVVGAGATGGYFGGRLAQAGRDVTFLVRPGRAAVLRSRGLRLHTPEGTASLTPRLITSVDGFYDIVLISVKGYALEQALVDVKPAVGPSTVVIPLLNGMRHVQILRDMLGADAVWGGMCQINATLDADGDVVRMMDMQLMVFGPFQPSPLLGAVAAELTGAGFTVRASEVIEQEMWEKWVFLAALGAVTTLARGTVADVLDAPGGPEFALAVAAEVTAVATAAGFPPREPTRARLHERVTTPGVPATSSMYRDMLAGAPVEHEPIIGDLVAHADRLGVPVPHLRAARVGLEIYAARRTA